jgi:hypothetical protein
MLGRIQLVSKVYRRKQAYQFILDKIKKLEAKASYNTDKPDEGSNIIPLAELNKLKEGIADPSAELVTILKKLLRPVASEVEIEDNLLIPFQPETLSTK